VGLILNAPAAQAHAALVATSPQSGAFLTTAPDSIVLTWDDKVLSNTSSIILSTPSHTVIDSSISFSYLQKVNETVATVKPHENLGNSAYLVSWKVLSDDGHLVGGSFSFGVNATPLAVHKNAFLSLPDKLFQMIFWALLIVAFGAVISGSTFIFVISSFLVIIISGIRLLLLSVNLPHSYLHSGNAKISLFAIGSFTFLLFLNIQWLADPTKTQHREKLGRIGFFQLSLISSVFASQGLLEGHARDVSSTPYLRYLVVAHLLCAITWIGSVTGLQMRKTPEQYEITKRVSTVSVSLLIPLGSILVIYLGRPLNFSYKPGWIIALLAKVILISIAIVLGYRHHFSPSLFIENKFRATTTLKKELIVFGIILVSTTTLISFTPPELMAKSSISNVDVQKTNR
jgi:methionine-rich copper-binding protein CopC